MLSSDQGAAGRSPTTRNWPASGRCSRARSGCASSTCSARVHATSTRWRRPPARPSPTRRATSSRCGRPGWSMRSERARTFATGSPTRASPSPTGWCAAGRVDPPRDGRVAPGAGSAGGRGARGLARPDPERGHPRRHPDGGGVPRRPPAGRALHAARRVPGRATRSPGSARWWPTAVAPTVPWPRGRRRSSARPGTGPATSIWGSPTSAPAPYPSRKVKNPAGRSPGPSAYPFHPTQAEEDPMKKLSPAVAVALATLLYTAPPARPTSSSPPTRPRRWSASRTSGSSTPTPRRNSRRATSPGRWTPSPTTCTTWTT